MHEESSISMHSNMHTYVHVEIPGRNAFHGETWYNVCIYVCMHIVYTGWLYTRSLRLDDSIHASIYWVGMVFSFYYDQMATDTTYPRQLQLVKRGKKT
jgi:hypothetical protein